MMIDYPYRAGDGVILAITVDDSFAHACLELVHAVRKVSISGGVTMNETWVRV